jgi:hypothetical protein
MITLMKRSMRDLGRYLVSSLQDWRTYPHFGWHQEVVEVQKEQREGLEEAES